MEDPAEDLAEDLAEDPVEDLVGDPVEDPVEDPAEDLVEDMEVVYGDRIEIIFIDLDEEVVGVGIIIGHGGDGLHYLDGIIYGQIGMPPLLAIVKMDALLMVVLFLEMVLMIVYGLQIVIAVVMFTIEHKKKHYELKKRH